MKSHTLPVKRRPAPKGLFKRLRAVTRSRKQRVAATAEEEEFQDNSSKISRALTIIFFIHIVAIGLIFFHQKFLDGRNVEPVGIAVVREGVPGLSTQDASRIRDLPQLNGGDHLYKVKQGDNYGRIAARYEVDEAELRTFNSNAEIAPDVVLRIPKRIVANEPREVADLRARQPNDSERGLVEAIPVDDPVPPRAVLVRPNTEPEVAPAAIPVPEPGDSSYVVKAGDTLWGISNRLKIKDTELMRANGIRDPKRLRVGMTLKIPR